MAKLIPKSKYLHTSVFGPPDSVQHCSIRGWQRSGVKHRCFHTSQTAITWNSFRTLKCVCLCKVRNSSEIFANIDLRYFRYLQIMAQPSVSWKKVPPRGLGNILINVLQSHWWQHSLKLSRGPERSTFLGIDSSQICTPRANGVFQEINPLPSSTEVHITMVQTNNKLK